MLTAFAYALSPSAPFGDVFFSVSVGFFQRGISAMMNLPRTRLWRLDIRFIFCVGAFYANLSLGPTPDSNRVGRAHLRVKHRSFFSELGGICSPAFRANQSFSEATVRNVFEASCPGLLAQNTVALFVMPSMHNRIFVLALRNQEVVPSWHSPTSMKSFSRTTDLNLWRISIVLVYALVNATDRDASKRLPR
jgi:hypothetical protein